MKITDITTSLFENWKLDGEGDCYEAAIKMAERLIAKGTDESSIHIVHGLVTGQGKIQGVVYGHAWVEINQALVVDGSNGKMNNPVAKLTRNYYQLGNIDESNIYRYSMNEARRNMVEIGTYGPWHEE